MVRKKYKVGINIKECKKMKNIFKNKLKQNMRYVWRKMKDFKKEKRDRE